MNTAAAHATTLVGRLRAFMLSRASKPENPYGPEVVHGTFEKLHDKLVARFLRAIEDGKIQMPSASGRGQEERRAAVRTAANLEAMSLLASGKTHFEGKELEVLAGYSGWGGLSLEKVTSWPQGIERPEVRGLIHEYYTPQHVCDEVVRVLAPHLVQLPQPGQRLRVLEPSAGIGRFLDALDHHGVHAKVQAVEYSAVSAQLIDARFPQADVFHGPFEGFLAKHGQGALFDLVLANPPYGVRGPSKTQDRDRAYRKSDDGTARQAYAYFLRRGLDTLLPGGIGVFLVPAGFMHGTGRTARKLRERILLRHHLLAAYRLPSGLFSGAMLVTDLLFFRARGGQLPQILESDQEVLEGRYFLQHPENILGIERGKAGEDTDQTKKPRWGYQVEGTFERLPELLARPLQGEDLVVPFGVKSAKMASRRARGGPRRRLDDNTRGLTPEVAQAVRLGLRADAIFAGSPEGWSELVRDVEAWRKAHGNPHKHTALQKLLHAGNAAGERFLTLFTKKGELAQVLQEAPKQQEGRFKGDPNNAGEVALHVYRELRGVMGLQELARGWGEVLGRHIILGKARKAFDTLVGQGWAIDPRPEGDHLMPDTDYYRGYLWPRVDVLERARDEGRREPWMQDQHQRLLVAIGHDPFDEIEQDPRHGWLPQHLVEQWLDEKIKGSFGRVAKAAPPAQVKLSRQMAGYTLQGVPYGQLSDQDRALRCALGWINFDRNLFRPPKSEEEDLDKVRRATSARWVESWHTWLQQDPDRALAVEQAYNRRFKGFVPIEYSDEEIPVARWGKEIKLHWYQRRSVQRLADRRGGILALDVGMGKTFTGIYSLALARQQGWAQRPVIVVPNSLILKWKKDILRVLPDYNVGLIGVSERVGKDGKVVASTDSAADRGRKWTQFQAGLYDVMLVTFSMVGTTKINEATMRRYADQMVELEFEARASRLEAEKKEKKKKKLTEREKAILAEGTAGWIADVMELSASRTYDEGVAWEDLGVDFLMVDEGQNFKNLFMAKARDGGAPPKFMGGGQSSDRAWHLHLRTWDVRRRTGGAGVILLSATPAKNSPLEFYSLTHFTNPEMWRQLGIHHSEQFVERYIKIGVKPIVLPSGEFKDQAYAQGFKNLHELRGLIEMECEFRTADEVGLEIPDAQVEVISVPMTGDARIKYEALRKAYSDAANDPDRRHEMLSYLTRMSMVSVHPGLDESDQVRIVPKGQKKKRRSASATFKAARALKRGFESDKLRACALKVAKRRDCAHVIFVEYVAAHAWLEKTLIQYGIKPERIAMLNAVTAPKPSQRQGIAEAFNGDPEAGVAPLYDVVICNAVAYEGVDLQKRTCALHHVDLPYEPATLQQRNGRGVRQGNQYKNAQGRSVVSVYYYLSEGSIDIWRQQIIAGKRAWLVDLIQGQDRDTNNPADGTADDDELLIMMSDDKEAAREKLAALRKAATARRHAEQAQAATKKFRAALLALQAAAARQGEQRTAQLASVKRNLAALESNFDNEVWPYKWLHQEVRAGRQAWATCHVTQPTEEDREAERKGVYFEPKTSFSFVMEGQILRSRTQQDQEAYIGRVEQSKLWYYGVNKVHWKPMTLSSTWSGGLSNLYEHKGFGSPEADTSLDLDAFKQQMRQHASYNTGWDLVALNHWHAAPDAWTQAMLAAYGEQLHRESYYINAANALPFERDGRLEVISGSLPAKGLTHSQLLPPTEAGWRRFLEIAHTSQESAGVLQGVGRYWWNRKTPPGLAEESKSPMLFVDIDGHPLL